MKTLLIALAVILITVVGAPAHHISFLTSNIAATASTALVLDIFAIHD